MGIIIRQSAFNTVIAYLGVVLGAFSTLWLFPNILQPDQYGLTRILISLSVILAQFSHLGTSNIVVKFFPYFRESIKSTQSFLFFILVIPFGGLAVCVILFLLFKNFLLSFYIDQSPLLIEYYLYLIPMLVFVMYMNIVNNYIRALHDTVLTSFLNEVVLRIVVVAILILYWFRLINFQEFVLLFVGNYGLQLAIMFVYLIKIQRIDLSVGFAFFKKPMIRQMASYGFFALLGGLTTLVVGNIDIIMLSSFSGLDNTAIYAIAFYIGSVISIPKRSIEKIAIPVVSNAFKNNNLKLIREIYHRTSLNQTVAGSLLICGIWANIDNLIQILPPEYRGESIVILIIGLANLFDMMTGINGGIILTSQYYRFDLFANVLLVVISIVTNYILIPLYGMKGAAMATCLSILLYNLLKYGFVWFKFSMQPFDLRLLSVLILAAGVLGISYLIPFVLNIYVDIIIRSAVIASLFLGLIIAFNIAPDVNNLVMKSFDRLESFFKTDD